ncbi:MAG TPA: hypothetical protein VK934_00520 [Fimbriimonas sp.]|nr:hypothetical protein [Fimbriimonas sp.]
MSLALSFLAALVPIRAVLVSYPDPASENDCLLMTEALLRAGWQINQITTYKAEPSLSFLAKEVADARSGRLLVYLAGPATPDSKALTATVGGWKWGDLMTVLSKGGEIALISDTGHANLMASWVAPNVSALVEDTTWRDMNQRRQIGTVVHNGTTMQAGVLSYIIARELPFSRDMLTLAYRVNKTKDSASMAAYWADLPRVKVIGNRNLAL